MIKALLFIFCSSLFAIWMLLSYPPPNNSVDAYLITSLIQAECTNCGEEDIDYITYTVMNRTKSNKFPNTVHEVLFQSNQFKGLDRRVEASTMINSYVYKRVLRNLSKEEVPKVLFFIATGCKSLNCETIKKNRTVVFSTKNHIYLK